MRSRGEERTTKRVWRLRCASIHRRTAVDRLWESEAPSGNVTPTICPASAQSHLLCTGARAIRRECEMFKIKQYLRNLHKAFQVHKQTINWADWAQSNEGDQWSVSQWPDLNICDMDVNKTY